MSHLPSEDSENRRITPPGNEGNMNIDKKKVLKYMIVVAYLILIVVSSIIVSIRADIAQFPYYIVGIDLSNDYISYLKAGVSITNRVTVIYTFLLLCMYLFIYFKWKKGTYSKVRLVYVCIFAVLFVTSLLIRRYWGYDMTHTYVRIGAVMNSVLFWHHPIGSILFYVPSLFCFNKL